jgi:hypothetical protein
VARAVTPALLMLAVVACDDFEGINALNHTNVVLHFYVIGVNGAQVPLRLRVSPGGTGPIIDHGMFGSSSSITRDGCTVGDLVALDPFRS